MADEEQLSIIRQGVEAWNAWRDEHPDITPDLSMADLSWTDLRGATLSEADLVRANLREADLTEADLRGADLVRAKLSEADLSGADLSEADLREADLSWADIRGATLSEADLVRANLLGATLSEATLSGADLSGANLSGADLSGADLSGVDLVRANLSSANLLGATLSGADLSGADLYETIFANLNLSDCRGLESCVHRGPSTIDHRTLQRSSPLPLAFSRGVGLPDNLIDYLPSLLGQPIQLYSCFISYSSKDQAFTNRLHADLQNKGVRCWFAPEDMKIGDRIGDTIDTAIRLRDKLLLILSDTSMTSAWVTKEVRTALAEEEQHGRPVLFPIRVDDTVMDTTEQWAHDIKRTRHIGNFTRWKDHDAYQKALDRLLRDLRVKKA